MTTARDVVEIVSPMLGRIIAPPPAWSENDDGVPTNLQLPDEGELAVLVEALGPVPTTIDDIIRFTGLHAATVQVLLLELDLSGRVNRHPGQRVSLMP